MAKTQELNWEKLDPGIRETVRILRQNGIETTESCEGTRGHCYPEPTVCFAGTYEAGFRALAIAYAHGLKVHELRRCWQIIDGEPVGPEWQLVFFHPGGGGLHPVNIGKGKHQYEWGPIPKNHQPHSQAE
jgi:hypothetical protein